MTMRNIRPALLLLTSLTACGGGGGGGSPPPPPPPVVIAPQIRLNDLVLPAGAVRGTLRIDLAGNSNMPSLLEFDLKLDPSRLRWLPNDATTPTPDVQARIISKGILRVIVGDATNRDGSTLTKGLLVDLPVTSVKPQLAGDVQVELLRIVGSDAKGSALTLTLGKPSAVITIN